MLLNHARQRVAQWTGNTPTLCPDCGGDLIAKRGQILIWHWAHRVKPDSTKNFSCAYSESLWHLAWKDAYDALPNWEIETRIEIDGKKYRVDAANLKTKRVREFVHTISDSYVDKNDALISAGYDVMWIMDGEKFCSVDRIHPLRWPHAFKWLLKPSAYALHARLKPKGVHVHQDGQLYHEWHKRVDPDAVRDRRFWRDNYQPLGTHRRTDVWFPNTGQNAQTVLQNYSNAMARIKAAATANTPDVTAT